MANLSIESLETRRLLAADVSLNMDEGIVTIEGTETRDVVRVKIVDDQLVVHATSEGHRESHEFPLEDVKEIHFSGNDGDDRFVNHTDLRSVAYGNRGNDVLVGGHSDDELFGGPDHDRLRGRQGNDVLHGDHGDDLLRGGEGDDDLRGWYGDDDIRGGKGNDRLSGYHGDDVLRGGQGDDVLKGHEGDDILRGGKGNDQLLGWKGNDQLFGGKGEDYLSGWSGDDLLVGGGGNDELVGHAGRDVLIGRGGADSLDGGSDHDLLIGGRVRMSSKQLAEVATRWADSETGAQHDAVFDSLSDSGLVRWDRQVDTLFDGDEDEDWLIVDAKDLVTP